MTIRLIGTSSYIGLIAELTRYPGAPGSQAIP
jgi:hypothetical protein